MLIEYPSIVTEVTALSKAQIGTNTLRGLNFFKVFISEKGQDGKILTFNDPTAFLDEYFGTEKIIFKKHGQHPYDILNILRNKGTVHCLRVTPSSSIGSGTTEKILDNGTAKIEYDTNVLSETEGVYSLKSGFTTPRFIITATTSFANTSTIKVGKTGTISIGSDDFTFTIVDYNLTNKTLTVVLDDYNTLAEMNDEDTGWTNISNTASTDITIVKYNPSILGNMILDVQTKVVDTTLNVRLVYKSANFLETNDQLEGLIEATNGSTDIECKESGWKSHVIMAMTAKGKGSFYNDFGFELSEPLESNMEKYSFLTYNFKVYKIVNSIKYYLPDSYVVSFDPNALDEGGNSLFIENILKLYMTDFNFIFSETNLQNLIDDANALDDAKNSATAANFDFLSGYVPKSTDEIYNADLVSLMGKVDIDDEKISITSSLYNNGNFKKTDGLYHTLLNGSNGSLDTENYNADFTTMVNLILEEGFRGYSTSEIFDRKKFPIDIVLDGNYAKAVKVAMYDFINNNSRKNSVVILDCGITPVTALATKNYFREDADLNINDYRVSLYGQTLMIKDPYGIKNIKVTSLYFLTKLMLENFYHIEGLGRALAGKTFGTISGYVSGTLNFSPVDSQISLLFKNKINYLVEDYDGIRFMSHSTSQRKEDALTELPNVLLLSRLIKLLQDNSEDFQFYRNKPEKIAEFNTALQTRADEFKAINNYAIEKITVTVEQTEYDKIQKIARVNTEITYYGFIYSIVLSFTVI